MRVLVFGASGHIGLPTAQALVRAGHEVIGQSRSASNNELFAREEIEPFVCDTNNDQSWVKLVPRLDAIIDAAGGDTIKTAGMAKLQAAEEAAKKRHPTAAKLTYLYCSGTWVQGSDPFERRSDGSAITDATSLTAWRTEIEEPLTKSTVLNGAVIRPSLVYGRGGSITGMMFQQAHDNKAISWPGAPGARFATIHTDDVAQMFVLAVEKAPIAAGNVFDCTNPSQESVDLIMHNLSLLVGFPREKISYKEPGNPFEVAITTSRPLQPVLGRSLLGWQARKPSLTDALPQYYRSWQTHNGKLQSK